MKLAAATVHHWSTRSLEQRGDLARRARICRFQSGGAVRVPAESGELTLKQLQEIGQQVGIEPLRVAQAAAAIDARGKVAPTRRSFGIPIGVSRIVPLPRAPTDREWEQLVVECRSTFGMRGQVTATGGLREWSNGNLHVCVEPTADGEQLRLSTLKDDAVILNGLSVLMGSMSVLMGGLVTLAGLPGKTLIVSGMFAGIAALSFGANLIRMPRWARERRQQMAAIGDRAVEMLGHD